MDAERNGPPFEIKFDSKEEWAAWQIAERSGLGFEAAVLHRLGFRLDAVDDVRQEYEFAILTVLDALDPPPVETEDEDIPGQIAEMLAEKANPVIDGWLGLILDNLKDYQTKGLSLSEAKEKLFEVYDKFDLDALDLAMQPHMAMANLVGQDKVQQEISQTARDVR